MQRERMSNFELLRIVSMLGIVAIHYMAKDFGGMSGQSSFPEFSWYFSQLIYSFAYPLVNCFVLISGYFLINKKNFGIRKVIDLIIITAFYGIIGYIIGVYCGVTTLSLTGVFYSVFPFFASRRWFVETYIILVLLAPFINKAVRKIDQRSFQILLVIQVAIFSLWYSIGLSSPVLDDGYGIINFITLYLLGAYYRLFGEKTFLLKLGKYKLGIAYILCSLLTFGLSYFIYPFGYAFITNIIGSVLAFGFFIKIGMGYRKRINMLSAAAFDVYFVHSDIYTSRLLIYELLQGKLFVGSIWMIPHLIFVSAIVYLFGFFMYKLRRLLFSITIDKALNHSKLVNYNRII